MVVRGWGNGCMNTMWGNVFEPSLLYAADAVCVTTNSVIKANGRAVMGAGVAKSARDKYPGIDKILASCLKNVGNHVHYLMTDKTHNTSILSFPTKHDWKNPSDIRLIERSAQELRLVTDACGWKKVLLPKPGCSNGQLNWTDVEPVLDPYLNDERFIVCWL